MDIPSPIRQMIAGWPAPAGDDLTGTLISMCPIWANALRARGRLGDADRLTDCGVIVRKENRQTNVDRPYTETKERVGGSSTIEASS